MNNIEDLSNFGDQLKYARIRQGLTQTDVSNLTGISQKLISEYETNKRTPEKANRDKLRQALDFSILTGTKIGVSHSLFVLKRLLGVIKEGNPEILELMSLSQDAVVGLELAIKELESELERLE